MEADGRTLLRFDNFPDHPGVTNHHYHTPQGVYDDIEFIDIRNHIATFYAAMDDQREQ